MSRPAASGTPPESRTWSRPASKGLPVSPDGGLGRAESALDEARELLAQADQVREHGGRPRAPYERAEPADLTERLTAV